MKHHRQAEVSPDTADFFAGANPRFSILRKLLTWSGSLNILIRINIAGGFK